MKRHFLTLTIATASATLLLIGCKKEDIIKGGAGLEDWTAETHGYGATPNYDVVFNQNEVMRLDFVIDANYWAAMQDDLDALMSAGGGPGVFSEESPMYVPAQMYFNGKQWYDVGIRYKGNSSLSNAYQNGNGKLPLRIDMNQFENDNPNINGQTFYGFQELSLSSNFKDNSLLHEKIAADVFREFGVPAPRTAFYRVYVDHGDGPVYFGLYTMVEVVFDRPMLNSQFGANNGNCYKPDSDGAKMNDLSLVNSTYFPNKTNEGASLSDISELVSVLLSDDRTSNPAVWRSNLEGVLDVNLYLKYLAVNTTMKNWDTYGRMTHNFYLYNDPSKDKFVWIPWDNNEAFTAGPGGGGGPGGSMSALAFDFSDISTSPLSSSGDLPWPMISYLYADPVYKTKYDSYIDEFITTVFTSTNMNDKFNTYHSMIEPYVTGTYGEISGYTNLTSASDFDNSLSTLINYVSTRVTEADNYTP